MIIVDKVFRSRPLVIHSPRSVERNKDFFWDKVVEQLFNSPSQNIGPVQDLTIVTWNTSKSKGILEKSLDHLGIPYRVLGKQFLNWNNLQKITTLCKEIPSISTKFIMGIDSYDAVVIGDPKYIIERFLKTGLKLCYNGAIEHYGLCPTLKIEDKLYPEEQIRHLNGGVFIGYTKFVKEFFHIAQEMIPVYKRLLGYLQDEKIEAASNVPDDPFFVIDNEQVVIQQNTMKDIHISEQGILKVVAMMFYPNVGIDHKCQMFDLIPQHCRKLKINPKINFIDTKIKNNCLE